jgi:cell division septation protein DedD
MTSLLNLNPYSAPPEPAETPPAKTHPAKTLPATTNVVADPPKVTETLDVREVSERDASETGDDSAEESTEFEIVLGRRQVASTSLVAIVLVSVFSGVSYLIGKSMAPKAAAPQAGVTTPVELPQAPPAPTPVPAVVKDQLPRLQSETTNAPLFAEAIPGQVYLQVGVIEKGPAGIWAEGLRTHGLNAFVAPGPGDGLMLWRVMIGPLPDPQSYQRAKDALNSLGLTNFGRRYSSQ